MYTIYISLSRNLCGKADQRVWIACRAIECLVGALPLSLYRALFSHFLLLFCLSPALASRCIQRYYSSRQIPKWVTLCNRLDWWVVYVWVNLIRLLIIPRIELLWCVYNAKVYSSVDGIILDCYRRSTFNFLTVNWRIFSTFVKSGHV